MIVQSQFILQFGFPQDGAEKYPSATIESLLQETISGEWGTDCSDDSGTKVIRTTNFTNEGVLDLTDVVVRIIDAKKVEKKQLKKGDIILEKSGGTKDNPVGRLVYFEEEGVFLANNFTQVLRPAEDINSRYLFAALYYLYQTHKPLIKGLGNQTNGIQNLKVPQYLQLQISVPDRTAQDDFERICRQADKSKFDGLKSQFIDMFSCALQRKLSDVAHITMGASPDSNYYNTTNSGLPFYQGKTEFGDMYIGEATLYCSEPIRIAQPDDILMSVRAPVGTVNITKEECCIGRGLASIRPNGVEQLFLYYALKLKEKDLDALGTGTTFKAINKDTLYEFSIEVGTIDKQKAFVEIAQQVDKSKYLS